MSADLRSLSTSALAKALNKTSKQMFSELESLGWILRQNDNWVLTAKGEFEGGCYRESPKFGRYIVWPGDMERHKALTHPNVGLISMHKVAKHFNLTSMQMAVLMRELSWLKRERKGWTLTMQGEDAGGVQREELKTGIPFVLWPEAITEHPTLIQWVSELESDDLEGSFNCADGHQVDINAHRQIDNWLYFSGIAHAVRRPLPNDNALFADFYLPLYQLYIEYWGENTAGDGLALKMRRRDYYRTHKLPVIELSDDDLADIDNALPRYLLKNGVEL